MAKTDGFIEINGREAVFIAYFDKRWVDTSFSHAFGVKYDGHTEIENVVIDSLCFVDDDSMKEIDRTLEIHDAITQQIEMKLN